MTLEKLEVGMKVANYRKLCELLNEPVKNGGSSKSAQLKEWERHFAFERQGNAYIITEIYDTPKLSTDARMTYMQYAKAYDQLPIRVPKGRKEDIEAFAKAQGESVNGLVNKLVREAMKQSEDEWKRTTEE